MKIYFIIYILLFFPVTVFSQEYDKLSIQDLSQQKKYAIEQEDFLKAALYKKAIELKNEIKEAVEQEDFERAASLKKQLASLGNNESKSTISQAIDLKINDSKMDFYNVVYMSNIKTGSISNLERKTSRTETSSYNAVFVAGTSVFNVVDGYSSSIQLTGEDNVSFNIKIRNGTDPSAILKLNHLELHGRKILNRKVLESKITAVAYSGANSEYGVDQNIPLEFISLGNEVYQIKINQVLVPGEYAFTIGNNWFLFGVQKSIDLNISRQKIDRKDISNSVIYNDRPLGKQLMYLGVDYSMLKLYGDGALRKDNSLKIELLKGTERLHDDEIRHGRLENWLKKPKSILYLKSFGEEYSQRELKEQWIFPSSEEIVFDEKSIKTHIENYDVNYDGIGFVVLPVWASINKKELLTYFVWFDFESRKILSAEPVSINSGLYKNIRFNYFSDDLERQYKYYLNKIFK